MMKKRSCWIFFVIFFFVLTMFSVGCGHDRNTGDICEVSMRDYYTKEDFKSIIVGESTYQDVYNIAPIELMQVTSYGGFCEYPMQHGGYVRIKFYGQHLIVGCIEEVSLP